MNIEIRIKLGLAGLLCFQNFGPVSLFTFVILGLWWPFRLQKLGLWLSLREQIFGKKEVNNKHLTQFNEQLKFRRSDSSVTKRKAV